VAVTEHNDGGQINLASILNILWRRRLVVIGLPALGLVVGLLYGAFGTRRWSATATIRPGITAYAPDGSPWRQWQLKDISTWYDKLLYRQELVRRLGLPRDARPVIAAEFISAGLTNLDGGEVVTLWTTATSPELAAALIDTSLAIFNAYAEADSISSQLALTRSGLQLQVQALHTQLLGLDQQRANLDLQLEAASADSLLVALTDRDLGFELDKLNLRRDYFDVRIRELAGEKPRLERHAAEVDSVLRTLGAGGKASEADIPTWVRRDAVLDGGDVVSGLVDVRLRLSRELARNVAMADSFTTSMRTTDVEIESRVLRREATVRSKIRDAARRIGELELKRGIELEIRQREIDGEIASRRVQMANLTPLQRVGHTQVSDKPVRPRGLRATMILVVLGAMGGVVLGFVWDYLWVNRREIFRS
jgi:hypothetical protein